MKVSLGMKLQQGPFGGGNRFGHALSGYLRRCGVTVSYDLRDPDLDFILLTEPRHRLKISAYSDHEIFNYVRRVNPRCLVLHRINECDERKDSRGVNQRLIIANACADHTIFVSRWLKNLYLKHGLNPLNSTVIHNGGDSDCFNSMGSASWDGRGPLKVVTHHWSSHRMKGFDIYKRLDNMLEQPQWRNQFEFTYIGNLPEVFKFKNATALPPLNGKELADRLKGHHVYITASQNEPAGMHHVEGTLCGLPVLYLESGGLPEYCQGYGVSFTPNDFEQKLREIRASFGHWKKRIGTYPYRAERMCSEYYDLMMRLDQERQVILQSRRSWRWPRWLISKASIIAS